MLTSEGKLLTSQLAGWQFSPYATYGALPTDYSPAHHQPRAHVGNAVFSQAFPTPLKDAVLVCASEDALHNLDMDSDIVLRNDFVEFVAGSELPKGARPVAHRYGGHQFGVWMGQLGDGRAHILGEYINRRGESWQLQLKGSGMTPYSRDFDGRALLRSSIREMVASEACHFLGVPTTRSAALVVGSECVTRRLRQRERAAVLLRLAPAWFRVGSLEVLARAAEFPVLRRLCDFIVKEYYPDIMLSDENRYLRLFSEIAERTIDLVAKWHALGFTHGLLNTDNVSLLGLTLDYGPFGFMDCYDGGYVANSSDASGRFAFAKQPDVMLWNLGQLANSLKPLLSSTQLGHLALILKSLDAYVRNKILERFLMKLGLAEERWGDEQLVEKLLAMMQRTGADFTATFRQLYERFLMKLGLAEERWGDEQLVEKLLDMMQRTGADFTATFRQLGELDPSELLSEASLERAWSLKRLSSHDTWPLWVDTYRERLVKEAAEAHSGGAGGAGGGAGGWEEERRRRMSRNNPAYVPRNWMLHEAAEDAEKGDFEKVRFLLQVMRNPYDVQPEAEKRGFSSQPPLWAYTLKISCAS